VKFTTLAVLLTITMVARAAHAHERSTSHSTWTLHGDRIQVELTLSARDVASGMLGVDADGADASVIREVLVRQLHASSTSGRCAPDRSTFRARAAISGSLSWEWMVHCPPPHAVLQIESRLFERAAPHHMHVLRVRGAGGVTDRILSGAERTTAVTVGRSEPVAFGSALRLGIEHLIAGADHLVFLLMLIVASHNLRALAVATTGFTLGHSVTLALGSLGWVQPNTALVESLIGASIVVVAVERLWLPADTVDASVLRATLAATFGLIHGLGFAGALSEQALAPSHLLPALLGFNVGIELGQLLIAAGAWTTLSVIRARHAAAASLIAELVTASGCGAGVYWAITRIA